MKYVYKIGKDIICLWILIYIRNYLENDKYLFLSVLPNIYRPDSYSIICGLSGVCVCVCFMLLSSAYLMWGWTLTWARLDVYVQHV